MEMWNKVDSQQTLDYKRKAQKGFMSLAEARHNNFYDRLAGIVLGEEE